jgi:hypothetical protein
MLALRSVTSPFNSVDRLLLLGGLRLGCIRLAGSVGGGGLCLLDDLILAVQFIAQFLNLLLLPPLRRLLRCDRVS